MCKKKKKKKGMCPTFLYILHIFEMLILCTDNLLKTSELVVIRLLCLVDILEQTRPQICSVMRCMDLSSVPCKVLKADVAWTPASLFSSAAILRIRVT